MYLHTHPDRRRTDTEPPVLPNLQHTSQADVLVAGKGNGGLLKERCALLGELWAAGVKVGEWEERGEMHV